MVLYDNIRRLRKLLGMSQEELAALTGYTSRSSIAKIENGEVDLSQSKIEAFAKALHTTPQKLMGYEGTDDLLPINLYRGYQLPIFEYIPASCGSGSWDEDDVIDYIVLPSSIYKFNKHKKYFGQIAKGDSMIGVDINDGDLLVFEQCNTPENNMVGTFSVNNEKCFCKRVKIKDGKVFLVSENSDYMPIEITEDMDFKMVGLLKYIVKEFRQEVGA